MKKNAWKKYGAFVLAGALTVGAAGLSDTNAVKTVNAEEKPKVTLNIAGAGEEDVVQEVSDTEEVSDAEEVSDTEESAETEERVSLRVAGEDEKEASAEELPTEETEVPETEAPAEETEAPAEEEPQTEADQQETFAPIAKVESGEGAIITTDVSEIVESCMPAIVSINNISVEEVETYYYGTQTYEAESAASGIIVAQNEEELLIATNSHVVDGASELSVCFSAEAEDPEDLVVAAKIKGMDRTYELAVVAVQLADIPEEIRDQVKIATLGSSEDLKVGQAAVAIGNALGYGQSVTSGIVSALNREITLDDFSQEVILTDAAINFGNSGGALLNAKGEVIGINVAKEAGSAESMGYSIPIDTAIPVLEKLINKETRDQMSNAERGYMGATVVDVSDDAKELYNMPEGAFVYEVAEGSAAEAAGIKKGDVITVFDGESVAGSEDLIEKMSYYAVGETVVVEVQTANNGEYVSREVEVTLQPASADVLAEQEEEDAAEKEQQQVPEDGQGNNQGENQEEYEDEYYEDGYSMDDFGLFQDGFEDYNQQWNEGYQMFPFGYGGSMY